MRVYVVKHDSHPQLVIINSGAEQVCFLDEHLAKSHMHSYCGQRASSKVIIFLSLAQTGIETSHGRRTQVILSSLLHVLSGLL